MKITDKMVEHLNFQLDDLSIDGTKRFEWNDFVHLSQDSMDIDLVQENISKFNGTIKNLLLTLNSFDNSIPVISDNASLEEIFAALGKYRPHFRIDCEYVYYRLIYHLATTVQRERLKMTRERNQVAIETAGERGKIIFLIEKLCKIFGYEIDDSFDNSNEIEIIQRLTLHIEQRMKILNMKTIFENQRSILPPNLTLNTQQQAVFENLQEAIYQDFMIRRKMLLKRLDVTIQSFLWSEKAQGREEEILSAIKARRENLSEEPIKYTFEQILQAPTQLIHENTKKITEQKGGKKSLVKTIIIGSVPDRGGRTDDIRKSRSGGSESRGFSSSSYSGRGKHFGGRGGDRNSNKRGRF